MLSFTGNEILAVVIAASFAAGLNVYATVATLGLLSHVHAFQLPPALHLLGSWPVIVVCALLFGLEFFADKIPVFDLVWNALNTFVKVPVATLLSYGTAQHSFSRIAGCGRGIGWRHRPGFARKQARCSHSRHSIS